MAVIDIIILILLLLAVIKGLKDGLIRQAGGIAGLFIGIILAGRFSALLAGWLGQWINASENIVKIIALCMHLLGKLLEKIIQLATLGWVNRILGMVLSIATTVLLIGVLLSLIEYVNDTWFTLVPKEALEGSKGVQIITSITDSVFPYIKELFKI